MEDRFAHVREWNTRRSETGWWHSFELPDGRLVEGVSTLESQRLRLAQFPIPERLNGKRVLDIGTWDGWFAFEMERRGADVVAIDCWDNPRLREMHVKLGSHIDYRQLDVYELTPESVGRFDIVLFMGVLYHLKHPLLALERVCALTTDFAAIDSFVLTEHRLAGVRVQDRVMLEFYETDEFGGQTTNWCAPTVPCLLAFCRTAGFARVELQSVLEYGAAVACYRRWGTTAQDARQGPELLDLLHSVNRGINFQSRYDEYAECLFRWPETHLGIDDVKPEIGGFGVVPITIVKAPGDCWQVNFKVPPGLPAGWHEATVSVGASQPSNRWRVALDVPLQVSRDACIQGICDASTGRPNQLDLGRGRWFSLWVDRLPENADRSNLKILAGEHCLSPRYVEPAAGHPRQINVAMPEGAAAGTYSISVAVAGHRSNLKLLEVTA
jgi:tRNA (mo5U34)-methyltransferase